jgi:Holliday junction DNA helicase RuvA
MLAMICGAVTNGCVLTSGGVGYDVRTDIPLVGGDTVVLHIHHVITDSTQALYGFSDIAARDVFSALLAVRGVGGKHALALLADVGAAAIVGAVRDADDRVLSAAKGVGPTLAKAIIATVKLPDGVHASTPSVALDDDVVAALCALGYDVERARALCDAVDAETVGTSLPTEMRLRAALARTLVWPGTP